jgi:hypothetical protein
MIICFYKTPFGNSSEDYNRVLNQHRLTLSMKRFVQEMVKPDYNNWEGKQIMKNVLWIL